MINEKKILASMKEWQKTEEEHLKEWEDMMILAVGKDTYLEIQKKRYRNDLIQVIVSGSIRLIAIAILCGTFLYLR